MRIEKPINSLSTYVVFDQMELVQDHAKRYYGVPKDYRLEGNPHDNDPSVAYFNNSMQSPDVSAYNEAINHMSNMYWKILADDAETTYKVHGS